MSILDWFVMIGTTVAIVAYGIWKSRGARDIKGYLLSNKDMKWWTIGLSVMATQASAITFLSAPGLGFDDGMRFVQFYFGLPIAMIIISAVFIPLYHRLNVYTAYEYLEQRFDLKTRSLGALLFLVSRSIASGMTIYAPAIILSVLLGWDIYVTCILIGIVVIIYTVAGGTKAVSQTQKYQMAIILIGMALAGIIMILKLPSDISFGDAIVVAGEMGKLNPLTFNFDVKDKYNIWTGLIGGTFLALSYFGTDQSQVQRYLGGKSITEMRIGLLFNAILKIPMQFLILFIGAMMFVFYQFNQAPLFFNEPVREQVVAGEYGQDFLKLEQAHHELNTEKQIVIRDILQQDEAGLPRVESKQRLTDMHQQSDSLRNAGINLIKTRYTQLDYNDRNYIFLTFVINQLPKGLVGLIIAVILAASMSSTSSELNALGSTTTVDLYKRLIKKTGTDAEYLRSSRLITLGWGVIAIAISILANQFGNLIEAVNHLGSIFYGPILGIFVSAFFFKQLRGTAVFFAAILAEVVILAFEFFPDWWPDTFGWMDVAYLWYNLIGCACVVVVAFLIQGMSSDSDTPPSQT